MTINYLQICYGTFKSTFSCRYLLMAKSLDSWCSRSSQSFTEHPFDRLSWFLSRGACCRVLSHVLADCVEVYVPLFIPL